MKDEDKYDRPFYVIEQFPLMGTCLCSALSPSDIGCVDVEDVDVVSAVENAEQKLEIKPQHTSVSSS
jgi:hypothetical protein